MSTELRRGLATDSARAVVASAPRTPSCSHPLAWVIGKTANCHMEVEESPAHRQFALGLSEAQRVEGPCVLQLQSLALSRLDLTFKNHAEVR